LNDKSKASGLIVFLAPWTWPPVLTMSTSPQAKDQ